MELQIIHPLVHDRQLKPIFQALSERGYKTPREFFIRAALLFSPFSGIRMCNPVPDVRFQICPVPYLRIISKR